MDDAAPEIAETLEGSTRLFVPAASLSGSVPPREPAFFNPRARLSRDVSVAAYSALAAGLARPAVMLEALSGLGARGLRAACESGVGLVVLNDLNAAALGLAARSAAANGLGNVEMSRREACAFLLSRQWGNHGGGDGDGGDGGARRRADIVDIDPFGSPAPYLDCCLRAVSRGGLLSMTATDLQVLNGMFPAACVRRYGGSPVRRSGFGDEMSLRLMLGCLCTIAGRLDLSVHPLLVHSDQHYYRAYARIAGRADQTGMIGRLHLCRRCGWRAAEPASGPPGRRAGGRPGRAAAASVPSPLPECPECGAPRPDSAGPLWTGPIFDAQFARLAAARAASLPVGRECVPLLERAASEAALPAAYHTLDEAASRAGTHPPRLGRMVDSLRSAGYAASPTSLCPTGFRTDAPPPSIAEALRDAAR